MSYLHLVENLVEEVQLTGLLRGKVAKVYKVMGNRAGFTSTSAYNDIKEYDNAVANIPTLTANTLDVISSSVNDTAAGTGVRTVKVTYIDSSNNLVQSAAISLNGTTLVTSVLTGVNFVCWMETDTVGSLGWADGNIRLRINGGTVEVEQITALNNRSLSAQFMIPTGFTGYIQSYRAHAVNQDQQTRVQATVNSFDRSISTVFKVQANCTVALNTVSGLIYIPFLPVPALTKIKANTLSAGTAATIKVDVSFVVILISNT